MTDSNTLDLSKKRHWHMMPVSEVQEVFNVNLPKGLNEQDVLERLRRFGKNINFGLSPELAKVLKATVIRQGSCQNISLPYVVPGDIVDLKPGNRVPADLRLFQVKNLKINESMLNGNNLPVIKNTYAIKHNVIPERQKCMAFCGTFVAEGQGRGLVVARGTEVVLKVVPLTPKKLEINTVLLKRYLQRLGVIINSQTKLKNLKNINMIIIDMDLSNRTIAEIVRKLQVLRKLPCKFLVSQIQADRMHSELPRANIASANKLAKLTPMYLIDNLENAQFLTEGNEINMLKIVKALQEDTKKVLWVSDGQKPMLAMQLANLSLVIGESGRDDILSRADLILPTDDPLLLTSIFYNKK